MGGGNIVAGNYSGNLVRVWASSQETANFYPDPRHAQLDTPDQYPDSHQVPSDTGAAYEGTDFPSDVIVGGGTILATPNRSHDGLGGRRMVYTDDQHRERMADLHADDGQRSVVAHWYAIPPEQDAREVYSDSTESGFSPQLGPNTEGAVAVLRGNKTSYPQNNPEGIREGVQRNGPWLHSERRLGRRRYRYDLQPLQENADTFIPENVPAPENPPGDIVSLDTWKYPGSFTRIKNAALYRDPPAVDSVSLAADQLLNSDVIGGGMAG
jgi:hypothetical protein